MGVIAMRKGTLGFLLIGLLAVGTAPALAETAPVLGAPPFSRWVGCSMSCLAPPENIDQIEETYPLRSMIDWLQLRGYRPIDGLIRPHDTGVVYTGFNLELDDHREAAWVEIYEYPRPSAAQTFDPLRSRFAMYVPDFPSLAARDEYIRTYCQTYRLHNLVMLVDDEMYVRRFDPDQRRVATLRLKKFIADYQGFSPGNLDELRERIGWLEKALALLEGDRVTDYEQACALLSEFNMAEMRDPELFGRLQRARAKVGEYSRWLEAELMEKMIAFAGTADAPWLIANGRYHEAAAVGDATTLAALLALADSAAAADFAPPVAAGYTGDAIPIIKETVDLLFRLAPPESLPNPDDAAAITRCLDEELTSSAGELARIWREQYPACANYRIGEVRVIGNYAGAIIEFPAGSPSGGRVFVYLIRNAGGWQFLTPGWSAVSSSQPTD